MFDKSSLDLPIVSVDTVVFTVRDGRLCSLLVRRSPSDSEPFPHLWSLPGVMVDPRFDSSISDSAFRSLSEKAGLAGAFKWLEQLQTFGGPSRDPRGWSVSIAHYALVPEAPPNPTSERVEACDWFPVDVASSMTLAFDHSEILSVAVERLRSKVGYSMLAANLLPESFTISELQRMNEIILGFSLDKSAFRKRLAQADCLEPVESMRTGAANRPSRLWRLRPGTPLPTFKRSVV